MAVKRTPPIAVKGQFKLITPWSVDADRFYECNAIRSFPELLERHVDIFATVYEPMGLDVSIYERDRLMGANIITLMSDLHPVIHVPDTYIESYPDMSGMEYHHIVLSASLGAVPSYLDLSFLQQQMLNVVTEVVGVTPKVEIHSAPHTGFINFDQHTVLEANRRAAISQIKTDHGKLKDVQDQNAALIEKVRILEQVIKDNNLLG